MNILSVNKFFWRKGGSEAVFFNEMELLQRYGHRVIPFSMKSQYNLETPFEKYFVEEVNYEATGLLNRLTNASKVIFSFDARSKIHRLLRDHQFDIAHFHIFQHQISPSVFAPITRSGAPLVLTLHDLKPICPNYKMYVNGKVCEACKQGKFYHSVVNRCNKGILLNSVINAVEMYSHYALGYYHDVSRFIAVSRFYQQKMIDFGFSEDQVSYIPNMIEPDSAYPSDDDEGYALYFGRLSEEKDVRSLIGAMSKVPALKLIIAGTGPDEKLLQEQVKRHAIDNVKFVGFQSGDNLRRLIKQASFTVLPSKWYENCPMSILESFAHGKPVLGARIGGIPELIDDGLDGFHFTPEKEDEIAEKLTMMASMSRADRREMGINGYDKIKRNYSPEQHYEELMTVYRTVK
ncbi:MAG: glycosyltransferase family 4 protein [Candidatus Thiodiazotropha sp. (ex Dulcina madagascariensis)]|nr:glycosyltransferase family 4 protein [Candidatus Thiodiazotropha sp. (ex Dulcina madagascariensis)]